MDSLRVLVVAAPLRARSGAYKEGRELVRAARKLGLEWTLLLGVSERAAGNAPEQSPSWMIETVADPRGLWGIVSLAQLIGRTARDTQADIVISLIPQTDMALAVSRRNFVAYLQAVPWPPKSAVSRLRYVAWRIAETAALSRAGVVWVTTETLRAEAQLKEIVPVIAPGVEEVPRTWDGRSDRSRVVWAARYDPDKNPFFFLDLMQGLPFEGHMYGVGPLEAELRSKAPRNVHVHGWVQVEEVWADALAFVGTSFREAYGRSAVEAGMNGVPVVIADTYGCADQLIGDESLAAQFVLPLSDVSVWRNALVRLKADQLLRANYSDSLSSSARNMSTDQTVIKIAQELQLLESDCVKGRNEAF